MAPRVLKRGVLCGGHQKQWAGHHDGERWGPREGVLLSTPGPLKCSGGVWLSVVMGCPPGTTAPICCNLGGLLDPLRNEAVLPLRVTGLYILHELI